jgi:hypothetical protein
MSKTRIIAVLAGLSLFAFLVFFLPGHHDDQGVGSTQPPPSPSASSIPRVTTGTGPVAPSFTPQPQPSLGANLPAAAFPARPLPEGMQIFDYTQGKETGTVTDADRMMATAFIRSDSLRLYAIGNSRPQLLGQLFSEDISLALAQMGNPTGPVVGSPTYLSVGVAPINPELQSNLGISDTTALIVTESGPVTATGGSAPVTLVPAGQGYFVLYGSVHDDAQLGKIWVTSFFADCSDPRAVTEAQCRP